MPCAEWKFHSESVSPISPGAKDADRKVSLVVAIAMIDEGVFFQETTRPVMNVLATL